MPSASFLCIKSCMAHLEEDTPALGSLHHPSPVHLKKTEVVDRNGPVVARGPEPVEPQHTVIARFVETYSVVNHRTLTSPHPALSVHASQHKPQYEE